MDIILSHTPLCTLCHCARTGVRDGRCSSAQNYHLMICPCTGTTWKEGRDRPGRACPSAGKRATGLTGAQTGCSKHSADIEMGVIYLGVIAACRHWERRIQVFPAANGVARVVFSIRIMLVVWGEMQRGGKERRKQVIPLTKKKKS